MATSGSYDYNLTANGIIDQAFSLLGMGVEGGEPEEIVHALKSLNIMVKSWQAEYPNLWKKQDAILFPVASQAQYNLGPTGNRAATTWAETTLDADEAASQTVLSVTSTSGFTASDVIGIVLDDNTLHWTTISSFVTDDTVTVASGLASAAASGNAVFAYTSLMQRPLKVLDMQRHDNSSNEIDMFRLSREDYRRLPNKTSTGIPTNFYYDPQLTNGILSLWPVPEDENQTFRFTAAIPFEDFDLTTHDPDFPAEWLECLVYNLAVRMMPVYGSQMNPYDRQNIQQTALMLKDELRGWDDDDASLYLMPDYSGRR